MMFCTGCLQHLPPGEFWSQQYSRHLARCASCRFKAGQAAFEGASPQAKADDLTDRSKAVPLTEKRGEVRYLRNCSVRVSGFNVHYYRRESSNIRLISDPSWAKSIVWAFDNNPTLGRLP